LEADAQARLAQMLEEQHALLYGDEWRRAHARRWHDLNLDFHRQLLKLADNRWLTDAVRRACQLPIIFDSNLRPHNRDAALLLYRRDQAQNALEPSTGASSMRWGCKMPTVAESVMREHIIANRDLLVHHLREKAGRTRALV
jgi:GntR family transcriptional regulator of vanillate catabolism